MSFPKQKIVVVEGGLVPVFALFQIVMFDNCPTLETIKTINSISVVYHRKNSQMGFQPNRWDRFKLSAHWTPGNDGELRWCDVIVQGVPLRNVSLNPNDLGSEDFKTKAQMLDKMRTPEARIDVGLSSGLFMNNYY
jgi:predicted metal-binding transcription factor (methanogenesis marker protein 9)